MTFLDPHSPAWIGMAPSALLPPRQDGAREPLFPPPRRQRLPILFSGMGEWGGP
jgi:hypothetical protein